MGCLFVSRFATFVETEYLTLRNWAAFGYKAAFSSKGSEKTDTTAFDPSEKKGGFKVTMGH
jgi:hypothetical protein